MSNSASASPETIAARWKITSGRSAISGAAAPASAKSEATTLIGIEALAGLVGRHHVLQRHAGDFVLAEAAVAKPDEQVVEVLEFEAADPALGGTMTITTTLADAAGGTHVLVQHDGIPDVVPAADNETGTRMALGKLAALVEAGQPRADRAET